MDSRLVLPVNTVLDGSYRIARVVDSGGFGITYEAEDIKLANRVAIKEYYPLDFGDRHATMSVRPKSDRHKQTFDWGRSNFLEEARTLARFEHPSIVRVSHVFEANSTAYMVMRFEDGLSLETWLASLDRTPTQEELDSVISPLLDALDLMHAANFLHRDIAPDNIIIRTDGSPVLLDFGSARRAVAEAGRSLTGIVKAGYSPQEQYTSDSRLQGPWSDVYALGGTLYRAVTGRPPEEASLRAIDDRMLSAAHSAMGNYRPGFLAAIDACLEVRHTDRPQSVTQLRPLLLGRRQPKPATKRLAWTSTVRAVPRSWLIAAAAIVAVVGGAFGGFEYAQLAVPGKVRADAQMPGQEAARQADAAVTKRDEEALAKARADAAARRQEEERLASEKRAAEEHARRQAEAQRQEEEAAVAAKRKLALATPKGAYDGEWEVVGVGGQRCRFKSWQNRISIVNNQILAPNVPPGKVNLAGDFQYRYVAVGWHNIPPGTFSGKFVGDTGSGRYQYSNYCFGTMKLKRI